MAESNNKRIVKNTAYLYLRMLFTSFLSLYAARLILQNLGVEDFGIYNVVGGVVTFMGFLTATMSSATQRFLTYHLGTGDSIRFKQTFSLLINVYLIFCAGALVILEVVGPLYISHYMTIPQERVAAAQWVFQFSLLTFLVNTMSVPLKSSIVAYEKMGVYAYVGIAEVVLNLGIVMALPYISYDKLIIYALLTCVMYVGLVLIMAIYCHQKFMDCRYIKYWNGKDVKEILSYSGWNLFGSTTGVMNLQGQAIVLNHFFGPIVNGAKAVADRVNSMITQFSHNFYMAVTPQIIKSYASGNIEYMRSLVLNSSRYSFLMLYLVSVPLFVAMEPLLNIWLGKEQVSMEMIRFCQCTIIYSLVNILEQPLTMAVRATGDIKKYQVYVGSLTLTFIPLCIVLFLLGAPAYYSMLLLSLVFLVAMVIRVLIVAPIIKIKPVDYAKQVIVPISIVMIITIVVIVLLSRITLSDQYDQILKGVVSFLVAIMASIFIGLHRNERLLMLSFIKGKLMKLKRGKIIN